MKISSLRNGIYNFFNTVKIAHLLCCKIPFDGGKEIVIHNLFRNGLAYPDWCMMMKCNSPHHWNAAILVFCCFPP
jgi:hypothetical protein